MLPTFIFICIYLCVDTQIPQCTCGGQRTTCQGQFSSSGAPGVQTEIFGLEGVSLCPLTHLSGSSIFMGWDSLPQNLKIINSARLIGQWASEICLLLPDFLWRLELQTQATMLSFCCGFWRSKHRALCFTMWAIPQVFVCFLRFFFFFLQY